MKWILLTLGALVFSSCGIYNLEIELKNPLSNINIFGGLADKDADEAKEYQCQIEIDDANWTDAVTVCSNLAATDANTALYASALHGKNGGDLFAIIDAADDPDSVIKGYTNSIEDVDAAGLAELDTAISLLQPIADDTLDDNYEMQLAIMFFTRACARIRQVANDTNSNGQGDITAADINAMSDTELNNSYNDVFDSKAYLDNAGVTGTVLNDITDAITAMAVDKATWAALPEANKEAAIRSLFGL